MRIFLLERTPLAHVFELNPSPMDGDLVTYMRSAQDPTGTGKVALNGQGVRVLDANKLLTLDDTRAAQERGENFTNGWYRDGEGKDSTLYNGVSIGDLVGFELLFQLNPNLIHYVGEICRQIIEENPGGSEVLSDFTDTFSIIRSASGLPLGSIVRTVTEQSRLIFTPLVPIISVPEKAPYFPIVNNAQDMFRKLLGGLRPTYLWRQLKLRLHRLKSPSKPIVYIFWGHGQDKLIRKMWVPGAIEWLPHRRGYRELMSYGMTI